MIRSIRSMRPTSVALCIAAALALCLAVALAVIEAVPAHAQEGPDGLPVKPVITVGTDQTSIPEGTRAIYTLTRTGGDLTQPLTVSLVVTDLGQFMRGNYSLSPPAIPNHVTFRANSASAILELLARDDLRDIPDNILRVSLLPDSDYTIGGSGHAEVLVEDGDVAPEISLSVSEASVVEGTDLTFTLRRMGNTDNPVTVAMKTGPVGNTVFGLHRIEKNTTEITKTIRTEDDDLDEADVVYEARIVENDDYFDGSEYRESEYFTVAGERRATATVTDNDPQRVGIRAVWGRPWRGGPFHSIWSGPARPTLISSCT